MNNIERFRKVLNFEPVDRLPIIEWASWWDKTINRWYSEGLPHQLTSNTQISDYFGLDSLKQFWLSVRAEACPKPAGHGLPIINNAGDYRQLKENGMLYPSNSFSSNEVEIWAKEAETGKTVIWLTFEGFFWFPRTLFGIENHLYAFYDHCQLMKEINQDLVDYWLAQLEKITEICSPVFLTIAEDMSYNHGPMLSKQQFDEFLAPYYRQLVPAIKAKNIKVFVDSDGDVEPLIPWLKEVGIEGILPLERMAGVDVNKIRATHPDFLMLGGYDKTVMHTGTEAIKNEFERLLPAMKSGGFIPGVDHQTPPAVSMEDYKKYIEIYKSYAAKSCD